MIFLGRYSYQIENGRVDFPWELPDNEKLTWMIVENTNDNIMEAYCEICKFDEFDRSVAAGEWCAEEIKIISQGELLLDADGIWQVPSAVLKYLKTDEITFLGSYNFIEIFSAEDMERYEKLLSDSVDLLREIDF